MARPNETFSILVQCASMGFSAVLPGSGAASLNPRDAVPKRTESGWTRSPGSGGTSSARGRRKREFPQLGQDSAESETVSALHFGQITAGSNLFEVKLSVPSHSAAFSGMYQPSDSKGN